MNEQDVLDAIESHGARVVYDAAVKALEGDRAPLAEVGVACLNLSNANTAMTLAFRALSPTEKAMDHVEVIREATKIEPRLDIQPPRD